MNRRGKRLTFGVVAVGFGVVIVLAIAYRKPILEHVEAWRFQLRRETKTVPLNCGDAASPPILCLLARSSGRPVIFDPQASGSLSWSSAIRNPVGIVEVLRCLGWRVLEQRVPRRAYVVIREPAAVPAEPTGEILLVPFRDPAE